MKKCGDSGEHVERKRDGRENIPPDNAERDSQEVARFSRVPFSSRSQMDADMVLARALQEQERRAFLLMYETARPELSHGGSFSSSGGGSSRNFMSEESCNRDVGVYDGGHSGSPEGGKAVPSGPKTDEPISMNPKLNPEGSSEARTDLASFEGRGSERRPASSESQSANSLPGEDEEQPHGGDHFENDEAFARYLQDAENQEITARFGALSGGGSGDEEYEESDEDEESEDEFDPDDMTYEELLALQDLVGVESKGLSLDVIESLQRSSFKAPAQPLADRDGSATQSVDPCTVCQVDFEQGDCTITLPCHHMYHEQCITQWLLINKACPLCSREVKLNVTSPETLS